MNLRHLLPLPLVAALIALAPGARADDDDSSSKGKFTDTPLTLKPLHFAAGMGLGFGTYQDAAGNGHVGWGSDFEAAIGLPFLGEFGARLAQRIGQDGILVGSNTIGPSGADHFARLFDPVVSNPGSADFANPEFHLRGSMVDEDVFQLGLETRLSVPTSDGSYWAFTPGLPMLIHIPGLMRLDVGAWLPVVFTPNNYVYILDIPVQAFFQVGDAFVGPESGVRINNIGSSPTTTDVPLGVGGGYTFGGIFDVKAQLRTERVNSSGWATQAFGGGIGVGLRVP
jgi:hypothetical protein